MVVSEKKDPALFRFVTDRNLLTQFSVLETEVTVALAQKLEGLSDTLLKSLNAAATNLLCETPGEYRRQPIMITNSKHQPPAYEEVRSLTLAMFKYITENWTRRSYLHLAAYSLWMINWIHPFVEGNGRTARAVCYYVLCVKTGMWLPGKNIIPQQIRADRTPYYAALRAADLAYKNSRSIDVSELEAYLSRLLTAQLTGP